MPANYLRLAQNVNMNESMPTADNLDFNDLNDLLQNNSKLSKDIINCQSLQEAMCTPVPR
ncbi:hypothetical protein VTN00DRAFT_6596 [Thermoascus crustaceus]|uniref:uncharacterized protein n=1 Tax=Thermoascus crustaceus TaxID=5088 RepID=UPI003743CABE